MNSRERVLSAFERTDYDRIPVKHEGTPEVNREIMDHFGLKSMEQLLRVVGDDFRYVQPVYCGPELKTFSDGSMDGGRPVIEIATGTYRFESRLSTQTRQGS